MGLDYHFAAFRQIIVPQRTGYFTPGKCHKHFDGITQKSILQETIDGFKGLKVEPKFEDYLVLITKRKVLHTAVEFDKITSGFYQPPMETGTLLITQNLYTVNAASRAIRYVMEEDTLSGGVAGATGLLVHFSI